MHLDKELNSFGNSDESPDFKKDSAVLCMLKKTDFSVFLCIYAVCV